MVRIAFPRVVVLFWFERGMDGGSSFLRIRFANSKTHQQWDHSRIGLLVRGVRLDGTRDRAVRVSCTLVHPAPRRCSPASLCQSRPNTPLDQVRWLQRHPRVRFSRPKPFLLSTGMTPSRPSLLSLRGRRIFSPAGGSVPRTHPPPFSRTPGCRHTQGPAGGVGTGDRCRHTPDRRHTRRVVGREGCVGRGVARTVLGAARWAGVGAVSHAPHVRHRSHERTGRSWKGRGAEERTGRDPRPGCWTCCRRWCLQWKEGTCPPQENR